MSGYLTKNTNAFRLMIFFLCAMTALAQAGLVLYTPAFLEMSNIFQVDPTLIKMTLTVYLLGFGVSQLFYGPLSDRWGRKGLLTGGMLIFTLSCLWSAFSNSYESLLISRIFQGIGAGSCMTLSRAILRDSFNGKDFLHAASFLSVGFALGLGLTPVIGGHLLHYFSWKSEFILLFVTGILLLIAFLIFLPETHIPKKPKHSILSFTKITLSNFSIILQDKNFMSYLVGGVMAYGVVIAYTIMGPFLFQQTMGYSTSAYGWFTLLIAGAYYASTHMNRKLIHYLEPIQIIKLGLSLIVFSGIFMLLLSLILHSMNIYSIMFSLMLATYGQAFIWSNTIALALQDLSKIAGTAAALFSCLQMILSAAISAILAIPTEATQMPLSIAIISLGLISWLIFRYTAFKSSSKI